jgi:uncharacterized protein (DUF433 family)
VALWDRRERLALFHRHFSMLAMRSGLRQFVRMENLIVIDPAVCNGRPVVKGTRITVQTVMEFLAAGDSVDEVLEAYPSLTRKQVLACMEWASRLMGNHFQVAELA